MTGPLEALAKAAAAGASPEEIDRLAAELNEQTELLEQRNEVARETAEHLQLVEALMRICGCTNYITLGTGDYDVDIRAGYIAHRPGCRYPI